ncbi:DUF2182 domain-containing protein [Kiloniella majae]|uniref:DUF2182 domain-containing protein n=1 Tax=Kiloniella majae TaxID=1938558 RepID=UPI001C3FCB9B|nr:DUF2182 domain-containing protein [Kiloniella majae]
MSAKITTPFFSQSLGSYGPAVAWVTFFVGIIVSWWALLWMSTEHNAIRNTSFSGGNFSPSGFDLSSSSSEASLPLGLNADLLLSLCLTATNELTFIGLVAMWSIMSLAMMAPTAVPMLKSYQDILVAGNGKISPRAFWALLGGYLAVWICFSIPAAGLQLLLATFDLLAVDGTSLSGWLTTGLLALAGIYQFTPIKEACLSKCRSPMAYFMGRWQPGIAGAYRMGLHHGAICVGCCWALMLLGFVGGTMNPLWMFGAMVLMICEKLPDIGRYITRPLGIVLLAAALLFFGQTLGVLSLS